ncbi:hypothetical protein [Marinibactrum halimedae]|uniref:Mercuric transport protein MerT n=1 Tax=Marinibactrum halimedae TaxID=1444977 RepID=A0AA37T7Y3_9GAMM|nr:hypothetical protein [Marinibactrum halimedae]MCD9460681.1 hypothetical protein [Marinibactrum halimedae]GLS24327.1 hypothetical protein GCM10007877_00380 [Marinibactrum halimedae]
MNTKIINNKEIIAPTLALFTSFGTLLCCALPALLVTLGAGAALASIVATMPWLVVISKYKISVFSVSGFMILMAGVMQWKARNRTCPIDALQAEACQRLRRSSLYLYWGSILIWCIGFFFAFIAVHIFY